MIEEVNKECSRRVSLSSFFMQRQHRFRQRASKCDRRSQNHPLKLIFGFREHLRAEVRSDFESRRKLTLTSRRLNYRVTRSVTGIGGRFDENEGRLLEVWLGSEDDSTKDEGRRSLQRSLQSLTLCDFGNSETDLSRDHLFLVCCLIAEVVRPDISCVSSFGTIRVRNSGGTACWDEDVCEDDWQRQLVWGLSPSQRIQ